MGTPRAPSAPPDYFESALRSLRKPQESERLLKTLLAVRKEIDGSKKNVSKIRTQGCLKPLVGALAHRNAKIVNTALSILGYCCLDRTSSAELVRRYGLLPYLHKVLKEFTHDGIQGRGLKLLGNLCQHRDRLAYVVLEKEPYIIKKIVSLLKSVANDEESATDTTDATIVFAIRALREMILKRTVHKLLEFEVLEAIGMVLVKYVPIWEVTKEKADILKGVLAFLQVISRHKCNNSICYLRNTSKGNALVYLGRLALLSPYHVVAIMRNFDDVRTCLSDLPIKEVGASLMEILKDRSASEDSLYRNHLKCLCFLLQNPANKESLKSTGIILVLMGVMRAYTIPSYIGLRNCSLVISTLKTYLQDDISKTELIIAGIINIFADKLEWLVGNTKENEILIKHRYRAENPCEEKKAKKLHLHYYSPSIYKSDCGRNDGNQSPLSDISYTSDTILTPPASPLSNDQREQSDSDDYSPVCSDSENDADVESNNQEHSNMEFEISPYYDESLKDESLEKPQISDNLLDLKAELGKSIIELAKELSFTSGLYPELLNPRFLTAMLKFLQLDVENELVNSVIKTISNVTKQPQYLLPLMETNFFFVIYAFLKKKHYNDCFICDILEATVQNILHVVTEYATNSGKGDIAHKLLRNEIQNKKKLVPCIPLIINCRPILRKLMSSCGGLDILLELFRNLEDRSIIGLCALAQKLKVKNPVMLQHKVHQVHLNEDDADKDRQHSVTFILDDESTVEADRNFLSSRSEYFSSLLSGTFKEANEEQVRLCNVESKPLRILFQLMRRKFELLAVYNFHEELDVLLDVITLADRFLIDDVSPYLSNAIQYFKLNSRTVPVIYQWSVESRTDILRVEAVAFSLVADVRFHIRHQIFQRIFNAGFANYMVEDVRNMLVQFLNIYS